MAVAIYGLLMFRLFGPDFAHGIDPRLVGTWQLESGRPAHVPPHEFWFEISSWGTLERGDLPIFKVSTFGEHTVTLRVVNRRRSLPLAIDGDRINVLDAGGNAPALMLRLIAQQRDPLTSFRIVRFEGERVVLKFDGWPEMVFAKQYPSGPPPP